jgi:hypothetical protein
MSCSALNICATSKEIFLLGAYLPATLNKALIYMCMCYSPQSFVCHVIMERLSIYMLDKLSIHTSSSSPFVFGLPYPLPYRCPTVIKTIAQRDSMTNKQQGSRYEPKILSTVTFTSFTDPKCALMKLRILTMLEDFL